MHENISRLIDEMVEIEKAIQKENARRTALEKQIFKALENCDFKKANDLLGSMDDNILLELQARFDALKESAEVLRKREKGEVP